MPHHRLRSLSIVGGFLDGLQIDFSAALNCFIGARGAGKTTLLEFLRYAIGNGADHDATPDERKRCEGLVRKNLGNGRIQVTFETKDGLAYQVSRSWGDEPIVLTDDGQPADLPNLAAVFKADIFSQSEVEAIADRSLAQLDLIDNFEPEWIAEFEAKINQVQVSITANVHKLLPLEAELAAISEELTALSTVDGKLKKFSADAGSPATPVNQAHRFKALRDRERRAMDSLSQFLAGIAKRWNDEAGTIERETMTHLDNEMVEGPNGSVIGGLRQQLIAGAHDVNRLLGELHQRLATLQENRTAAARKLDGLHKQQELDFRQLVEQHEQTRKLAAERAELERKRNDLLAKQRTRDVRLKQLAVLQQERAALLDELSRLRNERFKIRRRVADRINQRLSANIRVSLRQYGNAEEYQRVVDAAIKAIGHKPGTMSQKLVASLSPTEFAEIVRRRDADTLMSRAELNADQTAKVLAAFSNPQAIYDVETVDLLDLPSIELKDGEDYKDLASLSTGQKCTTILPILLLESDNPLLVDQPEDNLDNGFIFENIVANIRSVKKQRQLIFVTHNPNIPVLGDAEKVFVLKSDGRRATKSKEGTVDECKDEIVTLLEGGEVAFKRRKERYQY